MKVMTNKILIDLREQADFDDINELVESLPGPSTAVDTAIVHIDPGDKNRAPDIPDDDQLFYSKLPNPLVFPMPGDLIKFLNKDMVPPVIVQAQVTATFKTVLKRWPGW